MGGIWSIVAAVFGLQFGEMVKKGLGFIPLLLVLLFTAWDLWLWRWKPLVKYSGLPDLNGTWLGVFDSQWMDDDNERHTTTGPTALVIKQTFTQLSIVLVAEKSKSYSVLANVRHLESGEYRINYEYANTPLVKYRQKMPAHAGSAEFTIASARAGDMTGEYWTNRLSRGTLDLKWISDERVSKLEAAQNLKPKNSGRDK